MVSNSLASLIKPTQSSDDPNQFLAYLYINDMRIIVDGVGTSSVWLYTSSILFAKESNADQQYAREMNNVFTKYLGNASNLCSIQHPEHGLLKWK